MFDQRRYFDVYAESYSKPYGMILVTGPTGSGKTLSAFLWELNQLIVRGLEAPLPNAIQILYISPLKALNNDIQRNLELPLAQLAERFADAGGAVPVGEMPRPSR